MTVYKEQHVKPQVLGSGAGGANVIHRLMFILKHGAETESVWSHLKASSALFMSAFTA